MALAICLDACCESCETSLFPDGEPLSVQSTLSGNSGTNSSFLYCTFNDVVDLNFPDITNICWPAELDDFETVNTTSCYTTYFHRNIYEGGAGDNGQQDTTIAFLRNPSDGHIWIQVILETFRDTTFPFIPPQYAAISYGYLDTGLTIITGTDGPFVVSIIDPDVCNGWLGASCWNTTPGVVTITIL